MTAKTELRRLVDALSEDDAKLWLLALRDRDPHALALVAAPSDDEPATPEEDVGAAQAREQYRLGEFFTAEEAKARLLR